MTVGPIQLRDKELRNIAAQRMAGASWLEALPRLLGRLEADWSIKVESDAMVGPLRAAWLWLKQTTCRAAPLAFPPSAQVSLCGNDFSGYFGRSFGRLELVKGQSPHDGCGS
jgi:hypothetical protein